MKKSVCIVGTNGLPAAYGGFETLAEKLSLDFKTNFDVTVFCSSENNFKGREYHGVKLYHLPLKANGWQSVLYDIVSIFICIFISDIVIVLGSSGGISLPLLRFFKKKIITNIGGIEWKRDKYSYLLRRLIKLNEFLTLKFSNEIVVDNQHLNQVCKEEYGIDSTVIPYGGDHANKVDLNHQLLTKYEFLDKEYYLSVSRAQEDNLIHVLLEAACNTNKTIVVISNWQKNSYGKNLFLTYASKKNLFLLDAIYDQNELDAIRSNASCYIHTHSQCGTAPSLVEAMSLSLPVISYNCPQNFFTTAGKAVYFNDKEDLENKLNNLSLDVLSVHGKDMKDIALKKYKWSNVINDYKSLF